MNEMMILGILVFASIGMVIYALLPKKHEEEKQQVLRRTFGKRGHADNSGPGRGQTQQHSAARQMLEKVAPYAVKPVMPRSDEDMTTLREKLANAGFRGESASRNFLASKTIVALISACIALFYTWSSGYAPGLLFGYAAIAGGIGFMLPNLWLSIAIGKRKEKIRNGLPDSLDLLVVSVESGLALDGSMQRVADEMYNVHPELSEELHIATLEAQMGVPRSEALKNMARRTALEEMQALVAVIVQAEKFGTSVARALRNQADALRVKRRQKAEERAQKTTVKLMIPLILFIFPSIFVVLVGPAAMRIMEAFESGALGG
jgi:tight adherence protein C